MAAESRHMTAVLMSVCLSAANLGVFASPVITRIAAAVMKNDSVASRILFAAVLSAVLEVITFVLFQVTKVQQQKIQN